MPGRDLVIAAVLALLLHGGVALVGAPEPRSYPLSEGRPLAISLVSERGGTPKAPVVTVAEAKEEKKGEMHNRKETVPEKRAEKKADAPAEGRGEAHAPPKSVPAPVPESSPPPSGRGTGEGAEKMVTEVAIPCYKSNPSPKYPEIARRRGYEGEVLLSVVVSADGTVATVRVKRSSGHSILDRAAVEAVAKWEFIPARRMGAPVSLPVDIPVRFVLRRP